MARHTLRFSDSGWISLSGLVFFAALAAIGLPSTQQGEAAMTCFTIAGDVTCFKSGGAQTQPVAPIMAPVGPIFGGEDEEIVMRDDGGYVVERG